MKNLLIIALIILMSFSAGTQMSTVVSRPAQPKTTACFASFSLEDAQSKILEYTRKGFIVKQIVTNPINDGRDRVLVVMEKY